MPFHVYRMPISRLFVFVMRNSKLVDVRRIISAGPRHSVITSALSSIVKPDGSSYEFLDITTLDISQIVSRRSCFRQVIEGPVVIQDYELFQSVIESTVVEVDATLSVKFESFSVNVITTEEYITETGSETTIYYVRYCILLSRIYYDQFDRMTLYII